MISLSRVRILRRAKSIGLANSAFSHPYSPSYRPSLFEYGQDPCFQQRFLELLLTQASFGTARGNLASPVVFFLGFRGSAAHAGGICVRCRKGRRSWIVEGVNFERWMLMDY